MQVVPPHTGNEREPSSASRLTERPNNSCTFVTFYSFKGGVGRSRAVANIAYELAHGGYDVLVIDFDLEAPDLTSYFALWYPKDVLERRQGLVDMIAALQIFLTTRDPLIEFPVWQSFVSRLEGFERLRAGKAGHIDIITAGMQDPDYPKRVASINWSAFYEQFDGGRFIEFLRKEFAGRYQFVLIDSRTGFADISGICTIQLADIIVPMFTASHSSVFGIETVVDSARRQHSLLQRRRPLRIIPIPARIDRDVKGEDREAWMKWLCKQKVADWMEEVVTDSPAEMGFQQVMLFYQRQFSFRGEIECYVEDKTGQTEPNSAQYRKIVELILQVSGEVSPRRQLFPGFGPVQAWENPVERDFVESLESLAWPVRPWEPRSLLQFQNQIYPMIGGRRKEGGDLK